jgi:phosphatidate cytidylyltransferase
MPPHLPAFAFLLLSAGLIARGAVEGSAERLAWSTLALVWISLPLALLGLIRLGAAGERATLLTLVAVWAYDTGAFLGGAAFGRTRLAPTLSPKKSVEGVLFGVAAAMAACHALNLWLPVLPADRAAWFGAILGLCAQCGDLLESCLKRRADLKDSGDLIPGHGGLLDRIDGLVFAIPPAYALLRAFGS